MKKAPIREAEFEKGLPIQSLGEKFEEGEGLIE